MIIVVFFEKNHFNFNFVKTKKTISFKPAIVQIGDPVEKQSTKKNYQNWIVFLNFCNFF